MVTTSDGIWSPDAGDEYALTVDLASLASTTQDALNARVGQLGNTTARNNFTANAKNGVTWWDTSEQALYVFNVGTWTRVAPPEDSGWVTLSLSSNAAAGGVAPAYRRVGDEVYLRGSAEWTNGDNIYDGFTPMTLPAAITPAESLIIAAAGSTGTDSMRMFISSSSGEVVLQASHAGTSKYVAFDGVRYLLG